MKLPTLYKKTSTGKIQMWEINTFSIGGEGLNGYEVHGNIQTRYGLLDGKQQLANELIVAGKNLGKANETSPVQQAEIEAKSQWEQKVKKGYVENLDDAQDGKVDTNMITGGVLPMLAHTYEKQGHKIQYPAYVQPKLDGHRCIAIIQDGVCTLWSRTRKPIKSMAHIVSALEEMFPTSIAGSIAGSIVLDGELYNHDYRERFEELTSEIRQETPRPAGEVVQYWIYDMVTHGTFEDRLYLLKTVEKMVELVGSNSIVVVPTDTVSDEEEMINVFGAYTINGFEGLMVRNSKGLYVNKRSYDLQKVKIFQDAEFEVIDVTEGRGKMAGKAMFHCLTPEGKEFRVKMVGALDDLSHYLDHKDEYIGKFLTVKFQKLSSDSIPVFPVALRFREEI
jgi:DNA ligase-1